MSLSAIFPIYDYSFKRRSLLEGLPALDIELLTAQSKTIKVKKHAVIFNEGQTASNIYLVLSGKVKKLKKTTNNREQIFYIAGSGELIGYHALYTNGIYHDSAVALEDCSLRILGLQSFQTALKNSTSLNQRLLTSMTHEYNVLMNQILLFSSKTTRERLAIHIILLYNNNEPVLQANGNYQINVSRETLASLVGTVRENIVRLLAEFIESGILKKNGRNLEIINLPQLLKIANCKI